jgi:gliding motility-associated lipoprotein GldH
MSRYLLSIVLVSLALFSCRQLELYEKHTPIPGISWNADFAATGTISITDTTVPYRVYLVLRHTDAYKYENIWLSIDLQPPGDSVQSGRYNIRLADDAHGWEGTGMNDIWEVRKLLDVSTRLFTKKGNWTFAIRHLMRDNPLPQVMSVGLRVEKAL